MNKYYVYAHRNPITKEIFYIGKGTQQRAYDRSDRSAAWHDIVSNLRKEGSPYSIEILYICDSEEAAFALEKAEMAKYENLTNIRDNYTIPKSKDPSLFEKDFKYIGEQVRSTRIKQNIRATDLAKAVRISRITLQKIEKGSGLKSEIGIVLRVLDALGLHVRLPL